MWGEYFLNSIRHHKAASASIAVAALVASMLLSLTAGVFFNIWADDVRSIVLEEGGWHGKLTGRLSPEVIESIRNHPNVREAALEEGAAEGTGTVLIDFLNPRAIYTDLPRIAAGVGPGGDGKALDVEYHSGLLSLYLIFSPEESRHPPLVLVAYLAIVLVACASLVLIIHNAFQVSMDARLRQLGILKSVGATPGQIRSALVVEALALCLIPVIVGTASGAGLTRGFMAFIRSVTSPVREREILFQYSPYIALLSFALSSLTVWLSAWIPARRISRMSPMEAIRFGNDRPVGKMRRFRLAFSLLGIEGELARKSMYARRRAFRTGILSLTLASLVFFSFVNLEAISGISTKYTYFERYKDRWDLMLTVGGAPGDAPAILAKIRETEGVSSCVAFRSVPARAWLTPDMLGEELAALGGPEALEDTGIKFQDGRYRVNAPITVLDDESFAAYCRDARIGAASVEAPFAVVVNTIWDNLHSDRMNRRLIPYLREASGSALTLYPAANGARDPDGASVRIAAYAGAEPDIRQEFENFSLLQVMPESAYALIADRFASDAVRFNIRVSPESALPSVQSRIGALMAGRAGYELESRKEAEAYNVALRNALKLVVGALAGLLALIGLASVFSGVLGSIHHRKREFARYVSIGLSPNGVRKMLVSEALVVALKPLVISLLINIPIVWAALNASLIPASDYFAGMPLAPVAIFAAAILLSVGLSYFIGGKKLRGGDIVATLKDEAL